MTAHCDPRADVQAPIVGALNAIATRAVLGFAAVAGFASVPLIVELPSPAHELFHLALPAVAVIFAMTMATLGILRPAPPVPDPWGEARQVDSALARFARGVSAFMALGWLAAVGAVLVHHHLGSPNQVLWTLLVDVPLMLAVWLAAVTAWASWSRRTLARAEEDAAARLRRYWRRVAEPQPRA